MPNDKLLVKRTKSPHDGRVITCPGPGGATFRAEELVDVEKDGSSADPELEAVLPEAAIGAVVGLVDDVADSCVNNKRLKFC